MNYKKEMDFFDHLEELRWCFIKSLLSIIIGALATYVFFDELLFFLIQPVKSLDINLQVLKVTSMFLIKVSISFLGGFVISMPVVYFQIWSFISPIFNFRRKLFLFSTILFSTVFFLFGVIFCYYMVIPLSLIFFTSIKFTLIEVNYNFTLNGYLYFISGLLVATGFIFQLPILSVIGTRIGVITPAFLRYYRSHAIVIFLIFGAILTPPDPLSQFLIFIPLVFLYELSIIISWIFRKEIV